MASIILKKENQGDGQFNHGAILEKKPVVPSGNGKGFKPYSNLFYWAHAWSDEGSTIGEHPHQGFEILSFVMKGGIEHYDSANRKWIPLEEGDVQIIRAGSGISHSEKILPGSRMFQIWFDPELQKSIQKKATYNDYPASVFPIVEDNGITRKIMKGDGSPLLMDTPGVEIVEFVCGIGEFKIPLMDSQIYSLFLVEGAGNFNGTEVSKEDFMKVEGESILAIETSIPTKVFMISTPVTPGYTTYSMMYL